MKHGFLASALLLASAGFVSADYVIIVANVGGGKELRTPRGGGMRGMGGMGGMAGMRGGPGMPMGMAGMGGGMQMGMAGMGGGMPMGMAGMRGGMQMGMAGMQGGMQMGMRGGMQGGMQMGMRGMQGGMQMGMAGMRGGMPGGGMMGGTAAPTDADDVPDFVIAVVEVKAKNLIKQWKNAPQKSLRVTLDPSLGTACHLLQNPSFGELFVITEDKDSPIKTVHDRFTIEFEKTMKAAPTAADLLKLAKWTLDYGLVDKFPQVMDKLVEIDKSNPAAVAYLKVKADLERKAADEDSIAAWRGKLLDGYKVNTESPHYLIVHNSTDTALEMKTHRAHLENSFRGFYYWFALKGTALPVPTRRQVVVLTKSNDDFARLHKHLSSAPQVADGFYARRENLAVMTADCQDETYDVLKKFSKNWEAKGFIFTELLNAGNTPGVPQRFKQDPQQIAEAQMLALMLKALKQQAELATVSHDASRQLLFASGLLPRNVVVPEWFLFGMGSLFETPLESPWPTVGGVSPYYLPRWRELKGSDVEKKKGETLRKVVGDVFFRALPPEGKAESDARRLHDSAVRKARTLAWSLTYYLAQENLAGLRRYCSELGKMPRDLELDETVLLGCFARAFGCVDRDNKVIEAKLDALANAWFTYMSKVNFDSETAMKKIRTKIIDHQKKVLEKEKANLQNDGGQGQAGPMGPGGARPPGFPPPGGQQPGVGPRPPQ